MIGFGEGGEQQNFGSSEVSEDTKKSILEADSSPAGLLATLRQEVHTLVDGNLPETEQSQQVATRENVHDEHGSIIDVRFQQNGKSRNLKSLLPGTYTIELTQDEGASSKAYKKENKVEINTATSNTESLFNLTLLHEAGHMVDFHRNESRYQSLEQKFIIAQFKEQLLYSKLLDVRDGKNLVPGTITWVHELIDGEKEDFTPEAIEEITKAVAETSQYIAEDHSVEELTVSSQ